MSVQLFTENEISKLTNTLTANENILSFVETTEIFQSRKKYSFEDARETLGRAIWYGYVANRTAYNLQYQRNEQIDFDYESDDHFENSNDAIYSLGSLLYNITTNDGNVFLADEWVNLLKLVQKKFYVEREVEYPSYTY
jgi:hypothetical protein